MYSCSIYRLKNSQKVLKSICNFVSKFFCLQTEEVQIRKYSPFLESALLDSNGALVADEWQAVPDIWRTSAEKYGDHVALTDPYHDPPSSMTYKQVKFLSFFSYLLISGICFIILFSFVFNPCIQFPICPKVSETRRSSLNRKASLSCVLWWHSL